METVTGQCLEVYYCVLLEIHASLKLFSARQKIFQMFQGRAELDQHLSVVEEIVRNRELDFIILLLADIHYLINTQLIGMLNDFDSSVLYQIY